MNIFAIQAVALVVIVITWIIMAVTDPSEETEPLKWLVLGLWVASMLTFIGTIVYGLVWYE